MYLKNGFLNREAYLNYLAEDLGIDVEIVYEIAEFNGPSEDFDALPALLGEYLDGLEREMYD